jgi:hypothetical protein
MENQNSAGIEARIPESAPPAASEYKETLWDRIRDIDSDHVLAAMVIGGGLLFFGGIFYALKVDERQRLAKMTPYDRAEYVRQEKRGPLVMYDIAAQFFKDWGK